MVQEKIKDKKSSKKYKTSLEKITVGKKYTVAEACQLIPDVAFAKFDETIEVCFRLGVDPKHADQMVRGAVSLPHGLGKTVRVVVLTKGEKAKEALAAGADHVGAEDIIEKIAGGWFDFEKMIATPDMMIAISKIGKILGPRGLMPNPKLGTVTMDVAKAVKDQKMGKVEYRTEKAGLIHAPIGKKSFGADRLRENFLTLAYVVLKAKPPTSKGVYLRGVTMSATMSPGIDIDTQDVITAAGI
jgi:large subunit ribosomal protein L1